MLMLAFAALPLAPAAAQAQDASLAVATPAQPEETPPSLQGLVPDTGDVLEPASPLVGGVTEVAHDATGIALPVEALGHGPTGAAGVSGSESAPERSRSLGERAAAVATPAASAGLLAVALGALAVGGEGLRLLQARLAGSLGRVLRAAAGLLIAVPLFSRIERGAVLDNPQRARVHEVVSQDPGLSLSEVGQRAGIAWGTAVHHLRRLEAHGMVVSVRELGHRRFFISNTAAAAQRSAMSAVMHPTARRIAEFVAQRPGTDQAGICQALGLNNPAASKHLGQFETRGLVLSQRSGRRRRYHATSGLHSALLLLEPAALLQPDHATFRAGIVAGA